LGLLCGALVVLALTGLIARPVVERQLKPRSRFVYARGALSQPAYEALGARPGWATIALPVGGGVSLRGLIRRPRSPEGARWIVFFPGNDHTQLERGQKVLESLASGADDGLLVFAYRGFDGSLGKPDPRALADDACRILDLLLVGERVDPRRIHVVGFSLGGFLSVAAVAGAAKRGQAVRSLSLLATVTFVEMNFSSLGARFSVGDVYDTLHYLPDLSGPILLAHGSDDATLPLEGSQEMARKLGSRASFVEIPRASHDLMASTAAVEQVRAMIAR